MEYVSKHLGVFSSVITSVKALTEDLVTENEVNFFAFILNKTIGASKLMMILTPYSSFLDESISPTFGFDLGIRLSTSFTFCC
jgi:hypothetical protein